MRRIRTGAAGPVAVLLLLAATAAAHAAPRTANGFILEPGAIPAQEILAGGPPRDGIPALSHPPHASPESA